MIRYVLAVLLTVAIVGASMPAVDRVAAFNGERQTEAAIEEIASAAVSLVATEEVPPAGQPGARRTITVRFPSDSVASDPAERVRIERVDGRNFSTVTYYVRGRDEQQATIDAPIVHESGDAVVLDGAPGERTLHLTLRRGESGGPVVVLGRGGT